MKNFTFLEKESFCQQTFDRRGPYWHIATPGSSTEILFTNTEDYSFGMSLMAESLYLCGVRTYSFSLMSNHLHDIAEARHRQQCIDVLEHFGTRLRRYVRLKGRNLDIDNFVCNPLPVTDLAALRNNMVYVDRNGFVVNSSYTPFSYPWGTGFLYFGYSPSIIPSMPYASLPLKERRSVTHTRELILPDNYMVRNGFIAPESYVEWKTGRAFFRDAHQYFNLLTKNRESYAEFADLFGDLIVLNDEEMYGAAVSIATQKYKMCKIGELTDSQRIEIAKTLHFSYHAGNAQIRRILKLDAALLQELFPEAK